MSGQAIASIISSAAQICAVLTETRSQSHASKQWNAKRHGHFEMVFSNHNTLNAECLGSTACDQSFPKSSLQEDPTAVGSFITRRPELIRKSIFRLAMQKSLSAIIMHCPLIKSRPVSKHPLHTLAHCQGHSLSNRPKTVGNEKQMYNFTGESCLLSKLPTANDIRVRQMHTCRYLWLTLWRQFHSVNWSVTFINPIDRIECRQKVVHLKGQMGRILKEHPTANQAHNVSIDLVRAFHKIQGCDCLQTFQHHVCFLEVTKI